MASQSQESIEAQRQRLQAEHDERYLPNRKIKDDNLHYISRLQGTVSDLNRRLHEFERRRSELTFRRPVSGPAKVELEHIEWEIKILTDHLDNLKRCREIAQAEIRQAEAEMTGAKTKLKRELGKLEKQ
ncbi:hypothetical protein CDD83_2639 [Cordyceps sp. RAO-2017]|nr:hypothetical protein CDD83_2639 [Cordyceps sp. RAO-2017]